MHNPKFNWINWMAAGGIAVVAITGGFILGMISGVGYVVKHQMRWVETDKYYSGCMILPKKNEQ